MVRSFQKGATTFSCGMVQTNGSKSYSPTGTQVPFFEQYGTPAISNFYKGLTPTRSLSTAFFAPHGSLSLINSTDDEGDDAAEYTPVDASLRFDDPANSYTLTSYHLALTQYLFSGLFLRFNVQLGDQTLRQKPLPAGPQAELARVKDFTNQFDAFLAENRHPPISFNHLPLEIKRAGFFAGWHGQTDLKENFIKEIGGSLLTGYTFAPTHFDNLLSPGFLPNALAHGYSAHMDLTIQISDHVNMEAAAATTIYGRYSDSMHIVSDDTSTTTYFSGVPLLGMGTVLKDPGSLWVFECSLGVNRFHGFYVSGGYHFSYQEATRLSLRDTTVLLGASWTAPHLSALPAEQDKRLSSDVRLDNWKHHCMFVKAGFTPLDNHRLVPHFDFCVYFPVMGHRSVAPTRIYGGGAQMSMRWTF